MPRIPTSVIIHAYQQNPLLPLLLQECRSLDLAKNELRWLREHALSVDRKKPKTNWRSHLMSMCRERARGVPLQYIIGNQPFGDLEILCKRGVLIPRPETEYFTLRTAKLVLNVLAEPGSRSQTDTLHVLDLCTGTGCVSLLLHDLLSQFFPRTSIIGVDLSREAIGLAKRNIEHNTRLGLLADRSVSEVQFRQGDVLGQQKESVPGVEELFRDYMTSPICKPGFGSHSRQKPKCDVLVSNPPYISPTSFRNGTTARSVRIFEPKIALVPPAGVHTLLTEPCAQEDLFYHHILLLSFKLSTKLTVLECGDHLQAERVVTLCKRIAANKEQAGELVVETWNSGESYRAAGFQGPQAVVIRRLNPSLE